MNSRYIFAAILVILGVGLILDQNYVWDFGWIISTWWPLIIIAIGINHLASTNKSIYTGIIILVIGLLLQASELDYLPGGFWGTFWPLLLILAGLWVLRPKRFKLAKNISDMDKVDYFTVFGGSNQRVISENFKGGSALAVFGGMEIDLREAKISSEGAVLDLTAVFGGIEVSVPEAWNVITKGLPIFGAAENKTHPIIRENEIAPVLKINYFAMFGGIEINNFSKKFRR
jgi:predicted membrane protein